MWTTHATLPTRTTTPQNGYARDLVSTLNWANGSIAIPEIDPCTNWNTHSGPFGLVGDERPLFRRPGRKLDRRLCVRTEVMPSGVLRVRGPAIGVTRTSGRPRRSGALQTRARGPGWRVVPGRRHGSIVVDR